MSASARTLQAKPVTRSALHQQLYTLIGRTVKEVRITRVRRQGHTRWVAMVIGVNGREVPLYDSGLHHQAAAILRDAFPHADWTAAQNYDVTTGTLTTHAVRRPALPRAAS
ncbi:hypothetical protein PV413_03510 [Streptomyces scabiei]|uniref:hypothetical protein n=1 Tax=Streptomyces scabiei TaxID=1930 RepID=UPI000E68B2F1|nr:MULTISPECIES: hypothetical protein [Streptomyces]MDX2749591.1 hypothetical protein [Streptomyces scabiei]MDX3026775.1 hypothetical protein [Streptomyces scabiei]MDX3146541.1 hypothetical protein [Streptomyces scabiei]MDX3196947.1 hypothetical protein [Streptomyces scabiei]MDX3210053.1 hypothetical protein [Streptomyces scabiei]